jgi:hypothetical protein
MEAFVYCWTDKKTNKLYVGSHKGSTDDGYICSSKTMLEEYKKRPEDFSRQIVAEGELGDIRKLETKILQSVKARINENFYNKHDNDGFYFDGWKKGEMTAEHREKMAAAKRGKKLSESHKQNILKKIRGRKNLPEHKAALIASRIGSKHSEETKQKMREAKKTNPLTTSIAKINGSISQQKRKESGYYQSEKWKIAHKKSVEKRKANLLAKTNGGRA